MSRLEPRLTPTAASPATESARPPGWVFDNRYARELAGGGHVPWQPRPAAAPRLVRLNTPLAAALGLDPDALATPAGVAVLAGNAVPDGAQPVAQAYAGHQFGGFSPQLGDGRALLLGELVGPDGRRHDLALKGSGRTPFARGGDGLAALGPMLREYLVSESMHALGIPTTRALAVVATGEPVLRERALPGAVLTRVAASHLRVGSFEYFAARRQHELLARLAAHAIERHDPALATLADPAERHLAWLAAVAERQARLIAQWMGVGFIHGVMNTDNMTISGETIDYGPCAFMDTFDPSTVFSSIDTQGRYAYANQPRILVWNLARLAEAVLPLIQPDDLDQAVARATTVVEQVADRFAMHWLAVLRAKLGLAAPPAGHPASDDDDRALADAWLELLHRHRVDFTRGARALNAAVTGDQSPLQDLLGAALQGADWQAWLARWQARGAADGRPAAERAAAMARVNPVYIPRNHLVEEALAAASDHGDLGLFERLLARLTAPFDEVPGAERHALPAPPAFCDGYRTFCGT
jgi:uncharacterized protein YdiU (UPF0061 family)